MPHELSESLLRSDKVIIPYENIGGGRQVSTIVGLLDGRYGAFNLVDSADKYLGPVGFERSKLSSKQIEASLNAPDSHYEQIVPNRVDVRISSFILDNQCESVIEGIDFFSLDGSTLKLGRPGAAYPYCLVLDTSVSSGERS